MICNSEKCGQWETAQAARWNLLNDDKHWIPLKAQGTDCSTCTSKVIRTSKTTAIKVPRNWTVGKIYIVVQRCTLKSSAKSILQHWNQVTKFSVRTRNNIKDLCRRHCFISHCCNLLDQGSDSADFPCWLLSRHTPYIAQIECGCKWLHQLHRAFCWACLNSMVFHPHLQ